MLTVLSVRACTIAFVTASLSIRIAASTVSPGSCQSCRCPAAQRRTRALNAASGGTVSVSVRHTLRSPSFQLSNRTGRRGLPHARPDLDRLLGRAVGQNRWATGHGRAPGRRTSPGRMRAVRAETRDVPREYAPGHVGFCVRGWSRMVTCSAKKVQGLPTRKAEDTAPMQSGQRPNEAPGQAAAVVRRPTEGGTACLAHDPAPLLLAPLVAAAGSSAGHVCRQDPRPWHLKAASALEPTSGLSAARQGRALAVCPRWGFPASGDEFV